MLANGFVLEKRVFGCVDERGGEFAATTFLHIWFLPLIPTQSVWVIPEANQLRALQITWYPRSIAVAYLQAWAPVAAGACLLRDSVAAYGWAALAIAIWALSWTWRMIPTAPAQRRSDLHLLALGTRCEPRRMTKATRASVLATVTRDWQAIAHHRSPEDVARFGSANVDELILAYGVLAMHAVTEPAAEAKIAEKAEAQIFDGHHDHAASAGVFRSTGTEQPVLGRAELNEIVANRAAIAGYTQILAAEQAPKSWRQQVLWGKQRWLGYVLIACGITGGIAMVMNVRDPDTLDLVHPRKLAATIGTTPLDVRVTCDSIERHALPPTGGAWLCHIGNRILPMVGLAQVPASGVVHGTLVPRHPFHPTRAWEQWLERDEGVNLQTYEVFLDTTLRSKPGQIVLGGTVLLATLGFLVLWELELRHRARLLAGARSGMATTR